MFRLPLSPVWLIVSSWRARQTVEGIAMVNQVEPAMTVGAARYLNTTTKQPELACCTAELTLDIAHSPHIMEGWDPRSRMTHLKMTQTGP
jgi:hypothetical protein